MDINDEMIENFLKSNPEMAIELKWIALMAAIENADDVWNGREDIKEDSIKFMEVFHKHKIDPEVVVEAMQTITNAHRNDNPNDISERELTSFVSTLNKIKKKGEEKGE